MEQRKRRGVFHSLQLQYAVTYIGLLLAVLVLLNTYPLLVSQNLVFQSKQASLRSQANVVANTLAVTDRLTDEGVAQSMSLLDDRSNSRVIVTDEAGLVLYDTREEEDTLYRYALVSEVTAALQGNDVFLSDYAGGVFRSRSAVPIVARDEIIGCVCIYEADSEQGALLQGIQDNLRTISLVICAAAILLAIFFSKVLTNRVSLLLRAMRIVRAGEYGHRVEMPGRDEMHDLAEEFNGLTDRLQKTDEARRRFVSDASHELKTPLTSIRLMTDSILQTDSMDPETMREFVADIGDEATRLSRVSERLLMLTRLDAGQTETLVPVDVSETMEQVCRILSPLAKENGITMQMKLARGCRIRATSDGLYQIIFNLAENAIKYNKPDGQVFLTITREGNRVTLLVEDTGVGIPETELEKIFDRFYRVDKARSRQAGGSGLGLSIVGDLARLFGGQVRAERREEGGSRFVAVFPAWEEGGQ